MTRKIGPLLCCLMLLAACGDQGGDPETRANVVTPNDAARTACITSVLARAAAGDLASLDSMVPASEGDEDTSAALQRQVAEAAYEYAYEYFQFASLAATAAAYEDSAANHAQTSADSARYARAAASYGLPVGEPGSVQANAAAAFRQEFTALWNDATHPCNWEVGE